MGATMTDGFDFAARWLAQMYESDAEPYMDEARQETLRAGSGCHDLTLRTTGPFIIIHAYGHEFTFAALAPDARILAEIDKKRPEPTPEAKTEMAAIGASYLANLIRERQAKLKTRLADAGSKMTAVMDEMDALADATDQQAADAEAELADLKAALGLNSNGEPA